MCHRTHSKAFCNEKVGNESVRDSAAEQFYRNQKLIAMNAFCK